MHCDICHFRRLASRLVCSLTWTALALGASPGMPQGMADDPELQRFLARLGLNDLQTLLIEEQLEKAVEPNDQQQLARRLADLYAEQLVSLSDLPEQYAQVMRRIEQLTRRYPAAKTAALDVMLLQADYYRAEKLVNDWLADAAEEEKRKEAIEILDRIAPLLDHHQAELAARAAGLMQEIEQTTDAQQQQSLENQWLRVQSVAGRARYFAATSNYFLALVDPGASGRFARARELFRSLLEIEGEYAAVDPELLGLESVWRARALIGLALAEAALKNQVASQLCFAWLERGTTAPQIRSQLPFWRLRALLQQGLYAEALDYARQQVSAFSGTGTAAQVGFCVALVQAGFGPATVGREAQQIGLLGIAGLIKLRQRSVVRQLLDRYEVPAAAESGFYLKWIRGEQRFEQAEKTKNRTDHEAAAQLLDEALRQPGADSDLGAAAQCRLQLAWCRYRLDEREAAARLFEQAADGLKAAGDSQAADAAWMAFVAYYALREEAPRFVASAINVLEKLQRDFPGGRHAKRADYFLSRLTAKAATPAERIARLERVPADSENYLESRYEIATLRLEIWSDSPQREDPADFDRLQAAVDQYLQAAGDSQPARQLKSCLLVVTAAQQMEAVPRPVVSKYLQLAEQRAIALTESEPVVAEYHYRALQWAQRDDDQVAQQRHGEWLVSHARGSPYELPALIQTARAADERLQSATPETRQELLRSAYHHYQRLAELLGHTPERLEASRNARVATSRLAELAQQSGEPQQAARLLEDLLAAGEQKNRDYLRRAGRAHFAAGQHEEALRHWRTLLSGLPRRSEAWYEAKYFQLAALQQLDPLRFRQAAEQFRLLYPDLGPTTWRGKFAELLGE